MTESMRGFEEDACDSCTSQNVEYSIEEAYTAQNLVMDSSVLDRIKKLFKNVIDDENENKMEDK